MSSTADLIARLVDIRDYKTGNGFDLDQSEVKMIADEIEQLRYVLGGVRGAIKTGRNEPLHVWLDQINIALGGGKIMGECIGGHDCPSGPGGSCCGSYLCDESDLMNIYDAADILIDALHCADVEAQSIADRISGQRGLPRRCPDGVQILEDAEVLIRAALRAATVTASAKEDAD